MRLKAEARKTVGLLEGVDSKANVRVDCSWAVSLVVTVLMLMLVLVLMTDD